MQTHVLELQSLLWRKSVLVVGQTRRHLQQAPRYFLFARSARVILWSAEIRERKKQRVGGSNDGGERGNGRGGGVIVACLAALAPAYRSTNICVVLWHHSCSHNTALLGPGVHARVLLAPVSSEQSLQSQLEAAVRERGSFEKTCRRLAQELEDASQQMGAREAELSAANRASRSAQQAVERLTAELVAAEAREVAAVEEADVARRALAADRLRLDRTHKAALDVVAQERDTALATLEGVRYETSRELKALRAAVSAAERAAGDAAADRDQALVKLADAELKAAAATAAATAAAAAAATAAAATAATSAVGASAMAASTPSIASAGMPPRTPGHPTRSSVGADSPTRTAALEKQLQDTTAKAAQLEAALHDANSAIQVCWHDSQFVVVRIRNMERTTSITFTLPLLTSFLDTQFACFRGGGEGGSALRLFRRLVSSMAFGLCVARTRRQKQPK